MLAKLLSSLVLGEVVMPAGTYTVVDSGQLLLFLSSDNGVGWGHRTGLVHLFISLSILVSRLNPSPDLPSWLKPWRGTCNPCCLGTEQQYMLILHNYFQLCHLSLHICYKCRLWQDSFLSSILNKHYIKHISAEIGFNLMGVNVRG